MWDEMRPTIIRRFPDAPGPPVAVESYLRRVEEAYVSDAYHSLSIEGYRVSRELIERVRTGEWRPDAVAQDADHLHALAARGYWQAHQIVLESLRRVLEGENPGVVAEEGHAAWFGEMFAPSVVAGLLDAGNLAGYRTGQVYIRGSQHIPANPTAVRDVMPALFALLREEEETSVRVVLGHFAFVYIHPYMDGNGRMGRFLMNVMLASGGYPWTVIPVEVRTRYMNALEDAGVRHDISPFTDLLAELVERG
jgi:hypothetical protein